MITCFWFVQNIILEHLGIFTEIVFRYLSHNQFEKPQQNIHEMNLAQSFKYFSLIIILTQKMMCIREYLNI